MKSVTAILGALTFNNQVISFFTDPKTKQAGHSREGRMPPCMIYISIIFPINNAALPSYCRYARLF